MDAEESSSSSDHEDDIKCVAIRSYKAKTPNEMSFKRGDIIYVVGQNDNGWWQGETKDFRFGLFPVTRVKIVDTRGQNVNTNILQDTKKAICLFDLVQEEPEYLSFEKNEYLDIICDFGNGWSYGTNDDDVSGFVPTEYYALESDLRRVTAKAPSESYEQVQYKEGDELYVIEESSNIDGKWMVAAKVRYEYKPEGDSEFGYVLASHF